MLWYHPIARILLRKRDISGAREVMCKIYAYAKPEDIDLKVLPSFLCRCIPDTYLTLHLSPLNLPRSESWMKLSNNLST